MILLDTFSAEPFAGKHIVSIGFAVRREDTAGEPRAGSEVADVAWFTPRTFGKNGEVFHPPHCERFEKAWNRFG